MKSNEKLLIKKLSDSATVPTRGSEKSAGLDLYANLDAPLTLKPLERAMVKTGIAIALPPNTVGLVYARSGLATKHGIALSNSVGVIDEDYRGEISIGVINLSSEEYTIEPNDRIAQLVVSPVTYPETFITDDLSETERGSGGFGSTGN